jgi:3-oxoadipate enol-lactonase
MSHDPYDHDLERGMRNRRAILGDAWVDRSVGAASRFNADFQNFITRYAWHEVWGRPGLDARTRRLIVLVITASLARWDEFELHCRASLAGGDPETRPTIDEIREALIQTAIYAGVPAANSAHAIVMRLLRELEAHQPDTRWREALAPFPAQQASHPGTGRHGRTPAQAGLPALHYTVREARNGRPRHTVVLAHALGCDVMMWDRLANELAAEHRVICYDHRGHGSSAVGETPCSLTDLADDAARVIEASAAGQPVVFVGLSMGGMVAQELALRRPGLVRALVLASTCGGYTDAQRQVWDARISLIDTQGLEAIAEATMQRWFTEPYRQQQAASVARVRQRLLTQDKLGYLAASRAIRNLDTLARLPQLQQPALVIAAEQDAGTPVAMHQALVNALPHARLLVLPECAHLSVLEQPTAFSAAVQGFLAGLE